MAALCFKVYSPMLKELVSYLDQPDNDLWYDDGCVIARNIIDDNEPAILAGISKEFESWPSARQEHLAYILGEGLSEIELDIINKMLRSKYKGVVFRAKEALIEFQQKT